MSRNSGIRVLGPWGEPQGKVQGAGEVTFVSSQVRSRLWHSTVHFNVLEHHPKPSTRGRQDCEVVNFLPCLSLCRREECRYWLPYGWWRELCAQLQSGCGQEASLAALGSAWIYSSRCPSQGLPNHHSAWMSPRQQQVLEGKPGPPQPETVLCHPQPSKSSSSEPRLRLKPKKELSPRCVC